MDLSKGSCDKIIVCFGGGYNSESSIFSYYNLVCGILNHSDIIVEDPILDMNVGDVKKLVLHLKDILKPFWNF